MIAIIIVLAIAAMSATCTLARRAARRLDSVGMPNLADRCHLAANYSGVMAYGMCLGTVALLAAWVIA